MWRRLRTSRKITVPDRDGKLKSPTVPQNDRLLSDYGIGGWPGCKVIGLL
jgi:hypothetical protein